MSTHRCFAFFFSSTRLLRSDAGALDDVDGYAGYYVDVDDGQE